MDDLTSVAPADSAASATTPARSNVPEFTVGEISGAIKRTLEASFTRVRVRGEVSEVKAYPSGVYFSLKDEDAKLRAVVWKGALRYVGLPPENGLEVVATGKVTGYGGRSDYSLVVDRLEYAGEGALLARIERLRKALDAEGLFDPARKRPLPAFPEVIGVITSPQGAVIQDIRTTIARRLPRRILLWPVNVQGPTAARQVAEAIAGFGALSPLGPVPRPDVVIVARGGGSAEDLAPFSDEAVVRAAAASRVPLISAVGHETDTTLIDFASDLRAPTPTAAAELAVPSRVELLAVLDGQALRLLRAGTGMLERARWRVGRAGDALPDLPGLLGEGWRRLDDASGRLDRAPRALVGAKRLALRDASRLPDLPAMLRTAHARLDAQALRLRPGALSMLRARRGDVEGQARCLPHPREVIARKRGDLRLLSQRADAAFGRLLDARERRLLTVPQPSLALKLRVCGATLRGLGARLEGASYERLLSRGFAMVRGEAGRPVTRAGEVAPGARLTLVFADGAVEVADARGKRAAKGQQGSLL